MTTRRWSILCTVLGGLCIVGALLWLLHNVEEEQQAGQASQAVLSVLEQTIEESPTQEEEPIALDGETYLGYLTIPALGLELPVQAEWQMENLKISPCRYAGSLQDGGLVIAAHNYRQHFGKLSTLQAGDSVSLTDTVGIVHSYTVEKVETLQPTQIEEMTSDQWPLTLFTCTYGGKARTAVRCVEE